MNFSAVPLLIPLFSILVVHAVEKVDQKRLDEVAGRGAHVMPFGLEKTIHVFSKTAGGGLQQVIAKNRSDTDQIRLIRAHLLEISDEFSSRDFSKPVRIHGESMPGLAELRSARPGQLEIAYEEIPEGAQIRYSSMSPKLINAVHRWFDAQLSEHARHAVPKPEHHMHHQ